MKRKKVVIILTIIAVTIASIVVYSNVANDTVSSNISQDSVDNDFTNGNLVIHINEHVDLDKQGWMINTEGNLKEVLVNNWYKSNKSNVNCVVRAAIIPIWVNNKDGNEVPWAGNNECVKFSFKNQDDGTIHTKVNNDAPSEGSWICDGDSIEASKYFYYNQVLNLEKSKTENLLGTFLVDLNNIQVVPKGTDNNILKKYKNYKLIIDVKAEAVQVNGEAIKATWGINIEDSNDKIGSMLKGLCKS